jgi:carboxylesterase type B
VRNTSCASTIGTVEAIFCLRDAPLEELNTFLNSTGSNGFNAIVWPPVLDNDFVADFPANQLSSGKFVRVPILIGANTDEGTAFGGQYAPLGVHNDTEFDAVVRHILGPNVTATTGKSEDELVDEITSVYPNIQSIGIPSLESWPVVITNETVGVPLQYRRNNALFGDVSMHYARRRANIAWDREDLPSYSYRFDVTVNGLPGKCCKLPTRT